MTLLIKVNIYFTYYDPCYDDYGDESYDVHGAHLVAFRFPGFAIRNRYLDHLEYLE